MMTHQVALPGRWELGERFSTAAAAWSKAAHTGSCVLCSGLALPLHMTPGSSSVTALVLAVGRKRGKLKVVLVSDTDDTPNIVQPSPLFSEMSTPQTETLHPLSNNPQCRHAEPSTSSLLSVPLPLPILDSSSQWNQVAFVLWCLLSGFSHSAECPSRFIQACCSVCQNFLSL